MAKLNIWIFQSTLLLNNCFLYGGWGRDGGRDGEKHQCVVASCLLPTGDLAHNPGMCPDWEWNWGPFGSQDSTQSTEPHQPGQVTIIFHYSLGTGHGNTKGYFRKYPEF